MVGFLWRQPVPTHDSILLALVNSDTAVGGNHIVAMGNQMPYGITQCYLPPSSSDFPVFTPAKVGTRFSDPGGMQVDLGDGSHLPKIVCQQNTVT